MGLRMIRLQTMGAAYNDRADNALTVLGIAVNWSAKRGPQTIEPKIRGVADTCLVDNSVANNRAADDAYC